MSVGSSDRRKRMLTVTQLGGFSKVIEMDKSSRSGSGVSVFQDRDVNTSSQSRSAVKPSSARGGIISPSATARKSGRNIPAPVGIAQRTPTTTPQPAAPPQTTPTVREGSVFSNNYSSGCHQHFNDSLPTQPNQSIFSSSGCTQQPAINTPRKHRVITTPIKATSQMSDPPSLFNPIPAPERRRSVPAPPPPSQSCGLKKSSLADFNSKVENWKYSTSDLSSSSHISDPSEDKFRDPPAPAPVASDDRRYQSLTARLQSAELRAAALSDEKADLLQVLSSKENECRSLSKKLNDKSSPSPKPTTSSEQTPKPTMSEQPTQTDAASSCDQSAQTDFVEGGTVKSNTDDSSSEEVTRLREMVSLLESVVCKSSDDMNVSEAEMRTRLLDVVKKSLSEKEQLTRKLYTLEIQHKKDVINHDATCDRYESQLSELRAEVTTLRTGYRKKEPTDH